MANVPDRDDKGNGGSAPNEQPDQGGDKLTEGERVRPRREPKKPDSDDNGNGD